MRNSDLALLEKVTDQVIHSIEQSKKEIFDISETARSEMNNVKKSLLEVDGEARDIIELVDNTELKERKARIKLVEVSKNFDKESQKAIQKAYDVAHKLKVELILYRQKEKDLLEKRNELQIRLVGLEKMVKKADDLINHVSVALDYLLTNIKHANEQMAEYQQQKNIGYKIIKAQETERKRVAREIHDGPAQSLADVIFNTEIAEKMLSIDPEKSKEEMTQIKGKVRDTLQEIRRIIHQLRPMGLDDLGLIPTLRRYCDDFSEKNKINIEFVFFGREERFENIVEVTLFRIVQEALQNVYKHSRATSALVKLEIDKKIRVIVKDNGIGFNSSKVLTDIANDKYGLVGMKERVDLIKGELEIKSIINKGTVLVAQVPKQLAEEGM